MAEENKASLEQTTVEAKEEKIAKPKLSPVYDLLEGAIKIWWKNLMKFIKVYLWGVLFALIPGVVLVLASILLLNISQPDSIAQTPLRFVNKIDYALLLFLLLTVVCFLVALYFIIRAYIGQFLLVKNDYVGNELNIFKETKKYFWSYIWISILTTIFVLLWALLLIIPGIIFSVFYSFAVYAFFFEGLKGIAAIKRSIALVKNYWWAVFGRFVVIAIVLYVVIMFVSIPMYVVDEESLFYDIWMVITQILNFIIGPVSMLYFYQIYKELVEIKK